jgi:hydroxyethylthiazole kinase
MDNKTFSAMLSDVKAKRPLVHHITNYVTVNDCANITLCIGAAPVMAHSKDEVEEMVSMAGALVLNIGTLDDGQVESMILAGRKANKLNIPIILDPVGAGATGLRTKSSIRLLKELKISVLKGNAGEIAVLAGAEGKVRGVDSEGIKGDPVSIAKELAGKLGSTVAISGATDIVTDGKKTLLVNNGHEMMGKISGTGCMASSIAGAFAAVSKDYVNSTAAALSAFGIAGEMAAKKAVCPYSYKISLFDETYMLTPAEIEKMANVKVV